MSDKSPQGHNSEESAARQLRHAFAQQGKVSAQLDSRDLNPFYAQLNSGKARAAAIGWPGGTPNQLTPLRGQDLCAVIVETRSHHLLVPVILQFARQLDIPIQLYHGINNEALITESSLAPLIDSGQLQLTRLEVDVLSPPTYNGLLLHDGFWSSVCDGGKVLVFQMDSWLCDASGAQLRDFIEFDYIGASWDRNRPIGAIVDGGCGGLSLRDWAMTQDCIARFSPGDWPGGEDAYFAFHVDLVGGRVANPQESLQFAAQDRFTHNCFGVHQPQRLSTQDRQQLLEYCPEVRILWERVTPWCP